MLDDLVELLYRYPGACRAVGSVVLSITGLALIIGAYVYIGTCAASIATGMAGQPPITQVAQLRPGFWTWWVPESFSGILYYLVQGTAGTLLAVTAKKVQRQLQTL